MVTDDDELEVVDVHVAGLGDALEAVGPFAEKLGVELGDELAEAAVEGSYVPSVRVIAGGL